LQVCGDSLRDRIQAGHLLGEVRRYGAATDALHLLHLLDSSRYAGERLLFHAGERAADAAENAFVFLQLLNGRVQLGPVNADTDCYVTHDCPL